MRSIPGAFFCFNFVISFLISFRVNGLRRSCWCIGVTRSCSTSWLGPLLCGENTSERCSANRSAFSLSLFAQGPGGVEFLHIGGCDAVGFFLYYVHVSKDRTYQWGWWWYVLGTVQMWLLGWVMVKLHSQWIAIHCPLHTHTEARTQTNTHVCARVHTHSLSSTHTLSNTHTRMHTHLRTPWW